ncbi:hypothetical protein SAMN05443245_3424 [Paraburkholderia fungorum]|uniref:Uncharacterized protein n=1 Tax=Paraburkholderia fungorum TaxID=134537 RepID=A0A1H1H1F4_9BURK|nr:hypothetical protein [Paraburkholderia fungorum]SDR18908.1 hypothetical protein SAMN05443245_3424 [Paraburkholderia fungorum]
MNLKAIIQKIASWFKSETAAIEQRVEIDVTQLESTIKADVAEVRASAPTMTLDEISAELHQIYERAILMSTPAADTQAAVATTGNNVNTAVQLALALKAIDPSLSVEAVQAATSAALTAAYPVAAA